MHRWALELCPWLALAKLFRDPRSTNRLGIVVVVFILFIYMYVSIYRYKLQGGSQHPVCLLFKYIYHLTSTALNIYAHSRNSLIPRAFVCACLYTYTCTVAKETPTIYTHGINLHLAHTHFVSSRIRLPKARNARRQEECLPEARRATRKKKVPLEKFREKKLLGAFGIILEKGCFSKNI